MDATTRAPDPSTCIPGIPDPGRCLIMGILNVTPDSFSDGGRHASAAQAIEYGLTLAHQGADLVDVGGESTRPGAERIPAEAELARTIPVISALCRAGLTVSIDTTRAAVARAAIDVGAAIVNDVSGGLADPQMAATVASAGAAFVAMHWRGPSRTMRQRARYHDVVSEVVSELRGRIQALCDAGIAPERIIVDPGLGFAKTAQHDWQLLRHLNQVQALGFPVLVGASRKSFLGAALAACGTTLAPERRDAATAAVSTLAAASGAFCVRVHDVPSTRDAVCVTRHWLQDREVRRP